MAIKVDIEHSKVDYPKLMIRDKDRVVVLFIQHGDGVLIRGDIHNYEICSSILWDMSEFKDFNGSVTLTNDL